MMALPRSATKALGRWPWRHHTHGLVDTREGKDKGKDPLKSGFGLPTSELKGAESEPIEYDATAPIVRTPSKLVKKRGLGTSEKEPVAKENDDEDGAPQSRPDTPSVDSTTAEHVIVPAHQSIPPTPTPKPNVLVKKNSLSKRAASKPVSAETPEAEEYDMPKEVEIQVPTPVAESPSVEKSIGDEQQQEQTPHTADPSADEHATPVEVVVPDTPAAPLSGPERTPSPSSSHTHPFPLRGISLRSFGFFYGKDSRPAHAFPAYVPPTERVLYEEEDAETGSIAPSQRTTPGHRRNHSRIPIGLLTSRKPALPKVTKGDRRAMESAMSLQQEGNEPKSTSATTALRKVNQQLLEPEEANRVIAALRELPPPDLPPTAAQTVESVRKKKGWAFGRGGTSREEERQEHKESTGTVAMPIHGCCLDITDEEADEKHFSKLTGSAFAGSTAGTEEANANTGSADLSSLIPMLKNLRLVNLHASPDLSSVNAASLSAHMSTPDLGFGQAADKDGPLAGSVPTPGSLVDGMEKVGQTLMSLGFATTQAVLPSHVGIHPPKDRMSVLTYWWGYEVVFPPPTIRYLSHVNSISSALLNFLTAFALFSNGVREMLPFIRYIAQFIDFEWNAIKAQDKGRGVVCAATWVMPAALVPRPWDFVDPPMSNKAAPAIISGPPMHVQPTIHATSVGLTVPQVSTTVITEPVEEAGETDVGAISDAEMRTNKPSSIHDNQHERAVDEQQGQQGFGLQDASNIPDNKTTAVPEPIEEIDTTKYD
ncbi:hypothetical protein RHS01_03927 [Rhizoctonia solani]|uniref:Uncharacterized protein n=1 Tax=Rhizoctonia solani TaxID=456999 RepID=A0A8H7IFF4_9AGAM|nr:hypothetical protein RHS01_03927 [Rhizoctonia solani]